MGRGQKQPYFIRRRDRAHFAMAAIWDNWMSADGSEIETCAIVTTEANAVVAGLSTSMPVILESPQQRAWLDHETRDHLALLKPYPGDRMRGWPANPAVGNVRNQGIELLGE
jgi:putative SOS response-associated peptidase YedK